jgi:hypothetical protein
MNSAIQNAFQQYLDNFMDTIAERFDIQRDELDDLWKETQKKKFRGKGKKRRTRSRVPTAYILFSKDERPKIKDLSFTETAQELGRRWKNAPAHVRAHYQEQHDLLLRESQQSATTDAAVEEDAVSVASSITTEAAPPVEEEKPKKAKKPKAHEAPDHITNTRERDLWPEFAQLSIAELRTQCDHNNIKKSKNRNDMIHALVVHRIALEDGNTQMETDNEED